uniref:Uncharacterized protein n=1 Tax=Apteryx owenii TaxID=8824 RepID=A0A8B9PLP9_APTOW
SQLCRSPQYPSLLEEGLDLYIIVFIRFNEHLYPVLLQSLVPQEPSHQTVFTYSPATRSEHRQGSVWLVQI